MAAECSPGRKPGDQILLESQARFSGRQNVFARCVCRETSVAPTGLIDSYFGVFPGLTPGATFCRSLTRDSLNCFILDLTCETCD